MHQCTLWEEPQDVNHEVFLQGKRRTHGKLIQNECQVEILIYEKREGKRNRPVSQKEMFFLTYVTVLIS